MALEQKTDRWDGLFPLKKKVKSRIFCVHIQATEGSAAAANETQPEKVEYEEVTKTRKKTLRLPLKLSGSGFAMPKMTPAQIKVRRMLDASKLPCLFSRTCCMDEKLFQVVDDGSTCKVLTRNAEQEIGTTAAYCIFLLRVIVQITECAPDLLCAGGQEADDAASRQGQ